MKLPITSVLAYPYSNKYVVVVSRGDGKHLPECRTYQSTYTDFHKALNLAMRFNKLNGLLSLKLVFSKIHQQVLGA